MTDKRFRGAKVLITGASGFIGSHLCARLSNCGARVFAVSRSKQDGSDNGVQWYQARLDDAAAARDLMLTLRPDFVFHLAGHVQGSRQEQLVWPTLQSNFLTTLNLLTATREAGCRRILLAGSQEEPDAGDPLAVPCSPYAASKWAAGAYARMFYHLYDTPAVVMRIFMVYGPAQKDLAKLVPYVILSLLRGKPPSIGSGDRLVDWIYVDDAVEALLEAAQARSVEGETIDIGSGELTSIREVVNQLVRLVDDSVSPHFGARADRPLEVTRVADAVRTRAILGWQAKVPLEEGLALTSRWYSQQLRCAAPFLATRSAELT